LNKWSSPDIAIAVAMTRGARRCISSDVYAFEEFKGEAENFACFQLIKKPFWDGTLQYAGGLQCKPHATEYVAFHVAWTYGVSLLPIERKLTCGQII